MAAVTCRFDDLHTDRSWIFDSCDELITARHPREVMAALRRVADATRAGSWAWGWVSYEAAPAFDPAYRVAPSPSDGPPLVCFALGQAPHEQAAIALPLPPDDVPPDDIEESTRWRPDWSPDDHRSRVETVRAAIAAGQTYQVNLTTRLRANAIDDPLRLYARLAHAQRGRYNAYLDLMPDAADGHVVISASPELFFDWDGARVITRPMKGTVRRGESQDEDDRRRAELSTDAKQRAENIMIVDLLRNDLSRLAIPGTVEVAELLRPEKYETVWQLVSTISARTRPGTDLPELLAALFPCGSVTGAPKAAAMNVIAELERKPRGVYCGAIGVVAPPDAPFRARFSVPIRTAVLDRGSDAAVYGTGGAITWNSEPGEEYDELQAKAAVLTHRARRFDLLETLRFRPADGLRNLPRHLARMQQSARYFDIPFDADRIGTDVEHAVAGFPNTSDRRVRLLLDRSGGLRVDSAALADDSEGTVALTLDCRPTETGRWTRHKTTFRDHYEAAAARHPSADDVVLIDSAGYLLETTRASIAVRLGDEWVTPPLARGCLPGVERQRLIDDGRLLERDVHSGELDGTYELAVVSSLRGWRPARLRNPDDH